MERIILFLMLSISCSINVQAHMEDSYLLEGENQEADFTLLIQNYDGAYFSRYYYETDLKDHVLKGECDSLSCWFVEGTWVDGSLEIEDSISITQIKKHKWKGTWHSGENLSVRKKIKLSPIKDTLSLPISTSGRSLYQINRLAKIDIKGDTSSRSEVYSNINFFSTPSIPQLDTYLQNLHYTLIDKTLSCAAFGHKGEMKTNTKVHLMNDTVVSFTISLESNCDGTGTNTQSENITANSEGEKTHLEDYLCYDQQIVPSYQSQEWYEYRYSIFGHRLMTDLKESNNASFSPTDNSCDLNNAKIWQFPDWYLEKDSIVFSPFYGIHSGRCKSQTIKLSLQ